MSVVQGRGTVSSSGRLVSSVGLPAILFVLFGFSGGVLWVLGWNYEGLTGSGATKIHPSTYLIFLLFLARATLAGNPVGYLARAATARPAGALLAMAGVFLFATVVLRNGPGMAGVIDTYIAPGLLVLLLSDADERLLSRLTLLLHVIMTANALLGLAEYVLKFQLFPYRFDGDVFPMDKRSSAFQGHPLVNAFVTSIYTLSLMTGARGLPAPVRFALIGLQIPALVAFGGRSALVVTLVLGSAYGIYAALRQLQTGRVQLVAVAAAFLAFALVPIGIGLLATGGFFEPFIERFLNDGGSANARVEMLGLFDDLSLREIIVGPDVALIDSNRRILGLEMGIENPIVRMTLYQGAFVTVIMAIAVVLYLGEQAKLAHAGVWLPLLGIAILLNTAESIASKTNILSKFTIILTLLYARPGSRGSRTARDVPVTASRPIRR
nr:VpsF family polysaccharide biosynthesis protein [Chthonobacter albigriseus]